MQTSGFKIQKKNYVIKPVNLIMTNGSKVPVFLNRRVRLNANQAAIVSLRMKNYNDLSNNKQVFILPNSNSCCFRRSFSSTKSVLYVSVLLNTLDIPINHRREILKDSIKYLGRMADNHGIRPDPNAVEAVLA